MAEWNPVSSLAQALREVWGNGPVALPDAAYGLGHPVLTALLAPLAVRAFRTRSQD